MFTDIRGLSSGSLGGVGKDENGYIYTTSPDDPESKYADHKWTTVTIPYAGMTRFGLSWLICHEDSDGVKHYPYGDSDRDPNAITSYWFVDPRDGHCFYGRNVYEFKPSMLDDPTLDKPNITWTPPTYSDDYSGVRLTTPPPTVEVYIQYGSAAPYSRDRFIYDNREDAIKYDSYGNFDGTHYYIDDNYCAIIYEYDYFVKIANDELRTLDMPDNTPVLYETDYPDMLWRVDGVTNDGNIYSPLIPEEVPTLYETDYPNMIWRVNSEINNGNVFSPLITDRLPMGAFYSATKFKNVIIPKSCLNIGPDTFSETQLKSVTISSNCNYSENSFPQDCVVHFYPNS